jgi:hypothetical protein
MFKAMLAVLLLVGAVIYDPPRVLGFFGPETVMLGPVFS